MIHVSWYINIKFHSIYKVNCPVMLKMSRLWVNKCFINFYNENRIINPSHVSFTLNKTQINLYIISLKPLERFLSIKKCIILNWFIRKKPPHWYLWHFRLTIAIELKTFFKSHLLRIVCLNIKVVALKMCSNKKYDLEKMTVTKWQTI